MLGFLFLVQFCGSVLRGLAEFLFKVVGDFTSCEGFEAGRSIAGQNR